MSRFDAIRSERARPVERFEPVDPAIGSANARTGKKAVSAYFSREMSLALHLLALEQRASLQALMGEAFDDLFRKYGKHPFGER